MVHLKTGFISMPVLLGLVAHSTNHVSSDEITTNKQAEIQTGSNQTITIHYQGRGGGLRPAFPLTNQPVEQRDRTETLEKFAEVIHWKMTGVGHVWLSGQQDYLAKILGPGTQLINANGQMCLFFSQHQLVQ